MMHSVRLSSSLATGLPFSPHICTAKPKITAATISGSIARRDQRFVKSGTVKKFTIMSAADTEPTSPVSAGYWPVTSGTTCTMAYMITAAIAAVTRNVTIVTPLHPMLPGERRGVRCSDGEERFLCYAKPVTIGNDCWFGANVVVCPGVTIGDNCVIGAGSVVTKSIPANSFAAGVPARVIRPITEKDSIYNLFDEIH